MISKNLQPGYYHFKLDGRTVQQPDGERVAQSLEDGAQLADQISVATEANAAILQFADLTNKVVGLDDSPSDLNHTTPDRIILSDAPILDDEKVGPLGAPVPQGFVSADYSKTGGGTLSYRDPGSEDSISFSVNFDTAETVKITRDVAGFNSISLSLELKKKWAEVLVKEKT